ncbi:DUF4282 domain-containing protein [Actinomadura bangladeshensis]|uniref:DUF4282 domain-containing protein n=1 Tax=Actinomadura bangladeshensis TaxID=453573 RepID=A0A4V2XM10_9ACTN|nr:DUF4282 domain-containing protein [Actinomadura bangladeshensis]TDC12516.1 DUF4282 domain-containing protein [Actinomadura bangladeshensis]
MGGPYGAPPGPQPNVPGPRPPGPGAPGTGQQPWAPAEPAGKGLLAALLDTDFNALVTPKLAKTVYILSLMLITLECLGVLLFGLWTLVSTRFWLGGLILIVATPLIWLVQMLLVRIFMEAVVVRFKQAEYLRVIKDKS